MAVYLTALADGQLSNSAATTIYTCPAGAKVLIKSITLINSHTTDAKTVNLFVNRTGSDRRIIDVDKSIAGKASLVIDTPIVLEGGDILKGDAQSATTVDYTVSGILVQ